MAATMMTTSNDPQLSGVPPAGPAVLDALKSALPPWWVICIALLLFASYLQGKR